MLATKPTVKQLREQTSFSRAPFARYARVSDDTLKKLEEGVPVSKDSAGKVLSALNRVLGTSYTLDEVDVALLD